MVFIVYSLQDLVSTSAAEELKKQVAFEEVEEISGMKHFKCEKIDMLELTARHLDCEFLDDLIKTDVIIILSRHTSAKGLPSFTVHPEGNWTEEAKIGGKPKQLATASPIWMLKILGTLTRENKTDIPVTYEATHHGPFLKTPSLYAEIGGNQDVWKNKTLSSFMAKAVFDSIKDEKPPEFDKVAFGIGGLHYADKFAKLALSGKYAFSHIMSRHYITQIDMLQQGIERSSPKAEIAVMEWKSMNSEERTNIINKLNELGIDYAKV